MELSVIWQRFRANTRAYVSLWIFGVLVVVSVIAPCIANQKPLFIYHEGRAYFPIFVDYPETTFGGDFESFTDYLDPYVSDVLLKDSFVLRTLIPYNPETILFDLHTPSPTSPDSVHWLGTDDKGRDVLARMLYGLRTSLAFGFILTICVLIIGVSVGALQGYYGGSIDLFGQRLIEIWNSIPILFVIIIVANTIAPSFWWILGIVLAFSWIGLASVVRAEFLKIRNLEFVKAARVLGFSDWRIMTRHILPNAMVATITYLPFIMATGIITLGSLDFLGFGTQDASLGELLAQGKNNLTSPHLGISAFLIVSILLSVLVFVGEGLRDALDPRAHRDL
ncbi:ABC transporter permease [Helicobacter sp. TUL]|uniref:ABC transporter permease n=1 Tax=Helicobacter sp. TUL TaxID=1848928 RepID=UPI000BAB803A|nr:ABC transporter permease [Helicobacter sp. TUL]PAU99433.1 ABC transporter permease [Helicobacter sp. TUL]